MAELDKYFHKINAFRSPPPPPPRETSPTGLCKWDLWTTGFMVQRHLQNMPSSAHLNPKSLVSLPTGGSRRNILAGGKDQLLFYFMYFGFCRYTPTFLYIAYFTGFLVNSPDLEMPFSQLLSMHAW